MRKTLVNVVNIIEIHQLAEVGYGFGSTPQCRFMQRLFCGFVIEANETEKEFIIKQNKKYQVKRLYNIMHLGAQVFKITFVSHRVGFAHEF